MKQLIMFEGIPGSGKTTYALRLEKYFNDIKKPVKCYVEGDRNPADLAWCAVLDDSEFQEVLANYPMYKEKILEFSFRESGKIIIPYISIDIQGEHKALWDFFESKEIFNGRYSIDDFLKTNYIRWKTFAKENISKDEVVIFESVFMQNHVNEIILFHEYDYDAIFRYIQTLLSAVCDMNPLLIYLNQNDISKTIYEVASKRKSKTAGFPDWIDRVSEYIGSTPFAKRSCKNGVGCFIEFLEVRREIEQRLFKDLDIPKLLVNDSSTDYERGFSEVISYISGTYDNGRRT